LENGKTAEWNAIQYKLMEKTHKSKYIIELMPGYRLNINI